LIFTSINFGKKSNSVGNKFFNVISNSLEFLQSDIINRWSKDEKKRIEIEMPKLVNAYNYSHGHGDHFR
jgi:hypothetical protein